MRLVVSAITLREITEVDSAADCGAGKQKYEVMQVVDIPHQN